MPDLGPGRDAPRRVVLVDDADDPRLADFVGLRDSDLRRRLEPERGIFVAEGVTTIRALLRSPYRTRAVLVTPERHEELAGDLAGLDSPVFVAPRAVLRAVVGYDLHRGAVAAGERRPPPPLHQVATGRRLIVLEGLNDHENIGSVFRNAAAFGVDGAVLDPTCADPLYRRAIRVSLGHLLHVPFTRAPAWPDALDELRHDGWCVLALTPAADAEPIGAVAASAPDRVALVVGAEGPGLSPAALAAADRQVRIPMAPGVDSINVAAATAVALHRFSP